MGDHGDEEDIRLVSLGNEAAAARLYDRYARQVFAIAWNMLGERESAEDIVQDVFLKVWVNAKKITDRGVPVRPWILRVASNLCIDRKRKHREVLSDTLPESYDESADPSEELVAKERAAIVNDAIAQLPSRQRLALTLTNKLELSSKEAAAILEIGERALESLVARARRKLRESLAPYEKELFEGGRNE